MNMQKKQNERDLMNDKTETMLGVRRIETEEVVGYLINIKISKIQEEYQKERSAMLLYFIDYNNQIFKCYYKYEPYFFVACSTEYLKEMKLYIEKKFESQVSFVKETDKIDLEQINHLSGKKRVYLKIGFRNVSDMYQVRNSIKDKVEKNKNKQGEFQLYNSYQDYRQKSIDYLDLITDIREYDVQYHSRVCIDKEIRLSKWYKVKVIKNLIQKISVKEDLIIKPAIKILAFDIETFKKPLKFPDQNVDPIMMISCCIAQQAYLITNREIVGADLEDFEYNPKEDYKANSKVYNMKNESQCILRFFQLIQEIRPNIISSFNGDRFDWPYIDKRCELLGINMEQQIGVKMQENSEYYSRLMIHMDCFYWVERDSYLPQGSHGLKAVTKAKLGYQPDEVDPELMVPFAQQQPDILGQYAISDAVATYHLFNKHIFNFILALCSIIPLNSDEVLRKGSGTLCELLLMASAYRADIIFPNKKKEEPEKFYNGHLLDSETYIGGKVEGLCSGIYRSDFNYRFKFKKETYQKLIDEVGITLDFVCSVENTMQIEDCSNKQEIQDQIISQLQKYIDLPTNNYDCNPLIYHVDVAAMYPNIILTNRLQPVAIVDESVCSGCLFNIAQNRCKRPLEWQWRGEYFPLSRNEYEHLKMNLEYEFDNRPNQQQEFDGYNYASNNNDNNNRNRYGQQNQKQNNEYFQKTLFQDLPEDKQHSLIKKRVKIYCQKTYKKIHETKVELREDTVCMRENPFYIDTVRSFRDRRYEYKGLVKVYKNKQKETDDEKLFIEYLESEKLYESLQLAHKVILNSFYGYVMRRGARWHSMEMAAMVTHMGSSIISNAKNLIDDIGIPLELDTDGIWCMLPQNFPEQFTLKFNDGKTIKFDYPVSMLNTIIYHRYLNPQYQTKLEHNSLKYQTRNEMSIFFEIDGPYKAMIIPASKEENKQLKKRYAVYNMNNSIAEIKGFEIKRRGELEILKLFQKDLFQQYYKGNNLQECYDSCGYVADKYLDILYSKGQGLEDQELLYYITEQKVLSKTIEEYEGRKGVAITCANRLCEQLGDDFNSKKLICKFVISAYPEELPVSQRAIPIQIFNADELEKKKFLRKWLKFDKNQDLSLKNILDWKYYIERLQNTISKMIVIPSVVQKQKNPVQRVAYPDWLIKRINQQTNTQQIRQFFSKTSNNKKIGNDIDKLEIKKQQFDKVEESNEKQKQKGEEKKSESSNKFDMNKQFSKWLAVEQQKWIHNQRLGALIKTQKKPNNQLQSMLKQTEQQILSQIWHIVQIVETENRGVFKLWLYLENSRSLVSAKTRIPRIVYVNNLQQEKEKSDVFKQVKKYLPRNKKVHYLYEFTLDETQFQEQFSKISNNQTNPKIEGVYQCQIPLDFQFISQKGNICKFEGNYKSTNIYDVSYNSLQGRHSNSKNYMENENIQKGYLANLQWQNKSVYLIVFESIINIIFIQNNQLSKEQSQQIRQQVKESLRVNKVEFSVVNIYVTQEQKEGQIQVKEILDSIKTNQLQNFMMFYESNNRNDDQLLDQISLEFPMIRLSVLEKDFRTISSLDWNFRLSEILITEYIESQQKYENLMQLARYSQIPIGNFDRNNNYIYAMDVIYSRIVKQDNCVSWYSNSGRPDLGGTEDDYKSLFQLNQKQENMVNPGLYTKYCLEIDIGLLALNTICVSDELKNMDKEVSMLMQDENSTDELQQAKTAFKYLKTLSTAWYQDTTKMDNQLSDYMVQLLHRWICSGESKFYDPILKDMLNRLFLTLYIFLLNKLTQLQAQIVYSDRNQIIICTQKSNIQQANNYAEYLVKQLCQNSLFSYIEFRTSRLWKMYFIKDKFNYVGIVNEKDFFYNLNMSSFLPVKIQKHFNSIIGHYIIKVNEFQNRKLDEFIQEYQALELEGMDEEVRQYCVNFVRDELASTLYNNLPNLIRNARDNNIQIHNYQKQKLEIENTIQKMNQLDINDRQIYQDDVVSNPDDMIDDHQEQLQNLNRKLNKANQWVFQKQIGAIQHYQDPILELINFVVEFLQHDKFIKQNVITMKKNCLKFLKYSYYSEESKYKDPTISLYLYDVVCTNCQSIVDLDLFRDEVIDGNSIRCKNCSMQYDHNYIEQKMVTMIQDNLIYYQLQDLYCNKCNRAKDDFMSLSCPCSGKYVINTDLCRNPVKAYQDQIVSNFRDMADSFGFQFLEDVLDNLVNQRQ